MRKGRAERKPCDRAGRRAYCRTHESVIIGERVADLKSLSVIIPAYNESENILATLTNVATAFETLSLPHEILVIDDGSKDTTAALVSENLARFPGVRLLKNERNMGFGASYRRGVDEA